MTEKHIEELFKALPEFRAWIRTTKLFNALIEYSGRPEVTLVGFEDQLNPEIMMQLSGIHVSEPEDLPYELVIEFFRNSPFCNVETAYKLFDIMREGIRLKFKQSLLN